MNTRATSSLGRSFAFLLLAFTTTVSLLPAQDVRVYTVVSRVDQPGGSAKPVSHSLTLFHAGKVYDYVESLGEVVIFEPVHDRFIILGGNYTATEVTFTEINQILHSAETQSLKRVAELQGISDESEQRKAAAIRFQLAPEFEMSVGQSNELRLVGEFLEYAVTTADVERPQIAEQYLTYADWTARLNYVLHPQSLFPAARLELNNALRAQQRLPVTVELNLPAAGGAQLRAEHQYSWELQSIDKRHISRWEQLIDSNKIEWLAFQEYRERAAAEATPARDNRN